MEKCDTPGKGIHETDPQALHRKRKITIHSGHYASAASAAASVGDTAWACVTTSNGVGIYFEVLCLQNYFNHVC